MRVPLQNTIKRQFCRSCSSKRCFSSSSTSKNFASSPTNRHGLPFRMAVIGSGPAGFYTAYRVLNKLPEAIVDMYEALPVPYGLVRFGVAPDHPEVKNCIEKFDEVAQSPRFNFIGNTPIGTSLSLAELKPHYDCILLSYGASKDRSLGIPGEDTLKGIYSARAFVGWYNGLPEYRFLDPDLSAGEEAVVIGQGNVAMDVARILLSDVDNLRKTDITDYALQALSRSKVKRVSVVGRRGPLQASFTIKEVRELMTLPNVAFKPLDSGILPQDINKLPRAPKRLMSILQKGSQANISTAPRSWELGFQLAPHAFCSKALEETALSHITFEKTQLEQDPSSDYVKATGTSEYVDLPASLAFRSIGYKSEPISGTAELGIPFDKRRGIVCNIEGRVAIPDIVDQAKHEVVAGVYTSGWVKRGPTGVIASTMVDAFDTADMIVGDWQNQATKFLHAEPGVQTRGWDALSHEIKNKGHRAVSWHDWKTIEKAEMERGRKIGKTSEKFGSVEEMLAVL